MKQTRKHHRVFRLPFADEPASRARLNQSLASHGLFVPADPPEPIGAEFPLQLTFLGGAPIAAGRARVTEHGLAGRLRGYFVKYVELEPGSCDLPLTPRHSVTSRSVVRPPPFRHREPITESWGTQRLALSTVPEELTPAGIIPRTAEGDTLSLADYTHEELLHARDPHAWQGGLRPFDFFGSYQLIKRLGAGGMAEVILARRRMGEGVDKLVALKLVFHEYACHPRLSELFLTEARVSATLQHPNVIQVFDVSSAAGRPFLAMEYVNGRNGAELIHRLRERRQPPPVGLAVALGLELSKALEYLHGKRDLDGRPLQLVHRDVSPSNLLISLHGAVKLVDMGVASASFASGDSALTVGKRAYMAPEQALGGTPEPAWDLYGMGLVIHELLTLERPFERISSPAAIAASRQVRLRPSAFRPGVPEALDRLVQWATEYDRERRAPSAHALREALEKVRDSLPPFDLVQTMRELFGDELAESQRETETLIGVARQRDGTDAALVWRRFAKRVWGWVPRPVRLVAARHPRALRGFALSAWVALTVAGGVLWTRHQRGAALEAHLMAADRLIAAARLVGPGEDTALAQLKAARTLKPDDPRIRARLQALAATFEWLGDVADSRGDVAEAVAHFRAALEADPEREALRARVLALESSLRARPVGRRSP
ncbi:protein kinase [Myxococcaceae bacterium JPH2]|nr:protein kinase [Myxococcaceae bacterium JPH2]